MIRRDWLKAIASLFVLPFLPRPAKAKNMSDEVACDLVAIVKAGKHAACVVADDEAIRWMYKHLLRAFKTKEMKVWDLYQVAWMDKKRGFPRTIKFTNGATIRFYSMIPGLVLSRLNVRRFSYVWMHNCIDDTWINAMESGLVNITSQRWSNMNA